VTLRLVLADSMGTPRVSRHPALGRRGDAIVELGAMLPMPPGTQLVQMPERRAVTRDALRRNLTLPEDAVVVGAMLPIGYTRTLLPPATDGRGKLPLPLFGYTAVAEESGQYYVSALQTEEAPTWDARLFNTPGLAARVDCMRTLHRGNVVAEQLALCSTEYGCFTAQNTFYERWEMALPTSVACNARCIGCLSEQEEQSCPASQARITRRASVDDIVSLALPHLERVERPMVSFGQGCEGEPLLNWRLIEASIKRIRAATSRGWININTNGSDPVAVSRLIDAGLDSIRVSTFSAREATYLAYYRPRNYGLPQVRRSLEIASERGIRTAVNLLVFPGVTDRAAEIDALIDLFRATRLEQVQLRNLNIDPDQLMEALPPDDNEVLGVPTLVERLKGELPDLLVQSISRLPKDDGLSVRPSTTQRGHHPRRVRRSAVTVA